MLRGMRTLAALAVLGLIGGVVGVAVAGQLRDDQVQETRKELTKVSEALEVYKSQQLKYPSAAEGLEVLIAPAKGPQLLEELPRDAWDHELIYTPSKKGFELRSRGPDGVAETKDDMIARSRSTPRPE